MTIQELIEQLALIADKHGKDLRVYLVDSGSQPGATGELTVENIGIEEDEVFLGYEYI